MKNLFAWIIFSPRCIACKDETFEDNSLCATCWSKLSFIVGNLCDKCGVPLFKGSKCNCGKNNYFSKIRAAVLYDKNSEKLIYDFKYNDNLAFKDVLSKLMMAAGKELIDSSSIIIPVPLHKQKLRMRKFNQSLVLAKEIALNSSSHVIPDVLIRTKYTTSQSGLNKRLRQKNVKDAFNINKDKIHIIQNKTLLLIDDVITTGSTINECARILKIYGAKEVFALSFARTIDQNF